MTDPINAPLYKLDCLGFLKGSNCPHYDGENKRRPSFHQLISNGEISEGYAADDGVALHFVNEELFKTVSSRKETNSYFVNKEEEQIVETVIITLYIYSLLC